MQYLLDTNIFLWWLEDDKKLKTSVKKKIQDPQNQIFTSVASGWEISVKHQAGKLPLKTTLKRCYELSGSEILTITLEHILQLDKLPLHHKDPFDRILIAQALTENLTIMTNDKKFKKYKVKTIFS